MSNSLLIIGPSGSGKSSSICNLNPETTFVISILDKPLPFKGYRKHYKPILGWDDKEGNYLATDDWQRIVKCIHMVNKSRPEISMVVIDDLQYILANEFMRRSAETGYSKYTEMANHYWQIINAANNSRSDLISVFMSHNEVDSNGLSKIKTIGRLLEDKITIEGMFTTVLQSVCNENGYFFMTQNEGISTAKSPRGMFQEKLIENDLVTVIDNMKSYFNDEDIE